MKGCLTVSGPTLRPHYGPGKKLTDVACGGMWF